MVAFGVRRPGAAVHSRSEGGGKPPHSEGRVAIVGPVYPYRAGIAYCTTRLAQELDADVISFKRQYPKRFYPGGDDIDPTLPRAKADFILDILNPLTWLRARRKLREYDAVIYVWWIWVWAIPYRVMMSRRAILQCHNIGEKEPAAWKRLLANLVFRAPPRLAGNDERHVRLQPPPGVESDVESLERPDVTEEERNVSAHSQCAARIFARWNLAS